MKIKIEWLETKNPEWKVATITHPDGAKIDVSINKVSKKGEHFPNFDTLKADDEVEGELWQSEKGTWYLFPPKPVSNKPAFVGGGMKMMEQKARNIEQAQERKAESISYFNSVNSAIALVSKFDIDNMSEAELKVKLRVWRDWFLSEYKDWEILK